MVQPPLIFAIFPQNKWCSSGMPRRRQNTLAGHPGKEAGADFPFSRFTVKNANCELISSYKGLP